MKTLNAIALVLLIIGGLNWGLIGLFGFDMVAALFGAATFMTRTVYVIVGIAALYSIYLFKPVMRGEDRTAHRTTTKEPHYGPR